MQKGGSVVQPTGIVVGPQVVPVAALKPLIFFLG